MLTLLLCGTKAVTEYTISDDDLAMAYQIYDETVFHINANHSVFHPFMPFGKAKVELLDGDKVHKTQTFEWKDPGKPLSFVDSGKYTMRITLSQNGPIMAGQAYVVPIKATKRYIGYAKEVNVDLKKGDVVQFLLKSYIGYPFTYEKTDVEVDELLPPFFTSATVAEGKESGSVKVKASERPDEKNEYISYEVGDTPYAAYEGDTEPRSLESGGSDNTVVIVVVVVVVVIVAVAIAVVVFLWLKKLLCFASKADINETEV